jgi:DNA topoisomerase IA
MSRYEIGKLAMLGLEHGVITGLSLGTDATMAEHIKNVLEREYVSKPAGGQELVPTTLGMALVDGEGLTADADTLTC